jgi:hypothetical protein
MRPRAVLVLGFTLALTASASAAGPSLPDVNGSVAAAEVSYAAAAHGSTTTLSKRIEGKVVARRILPGAWGVPMVTLRGVHGGLSPDARTLVLGSNVRPDGILRDRSTFAVVSTRGVRLVRTLSLRGDYSFDALSPAGRWLYLIHHVQSPPGARYQVKAYDLREGRLLPGVIADKRQAGWLMSGYPIARAASDDGRWVYTLYQQEDNYPFVHALDTVSRTAVCIGIPWQWTGVQGGAIGAAKLVLTGHELLIAGGENAFTLDTRTFRVTSG